MQGKVNMFHIKISHIQGKVNMFHIKISHIQGKVIMFHIQKFHVQGKVNKSKTTINTYFYENTIPSIVKTNRITPVVTWRGPKQNKLKTLT